MTTFKQKRNKNYKMIRGKKRDSKNKLIKMMLKKIRFQELIKSKKSKEVC